LPKKVWSLKNPGFNWQTCQRKSNPVGYFELIMAERQKANYQEIMQNQEYRLRHPWLRRFMRGGFVEQPFQPDSAACHGFC
jgi:hypothetical protein